jgi:peptidoglycan/LPS O-acetylase OafA/YrhL
MKTCPYCGKQNPSEATVCAIDGQPLDPEMPPALRPSKTRRPKTVVDLSARPFTVRFAVWALALAEAIDVVRQVASYESHFHGYSDFWFNSFWYTRIFGFTFEALLLYFAYRGKSWARWVMLLMLIVGMVSILSTPKSALHWDFYFFSLIEISAMAALFQRSSNEWYKGAKTILSEPELVS